MRYLFLRAIVPVLLLSTMLRGQEVYVINVESSINPAAADYIHEGISRAVQARAEALVVRLNTPGGLLKSTRSIVTDLLEADLPVILYVSPSGAQAASAGVFITLAAHVAAMAPGTNIGAAHPVTMGQQMDSVMTEKAVNDAAAFIRSISERRHRNVGWAEESVRRSISITETEALGKGVVDVVAEDIPSLLSAVDGRVTDIHGRPDTLRVRGASIVLIEKTFQQEFLDVISDPNIAYILMMLGIYGLLFELYNPGSIFPGVVGVISLLIAFYALHTLPVNYAGMGLIIFAVILFLLEVKIVSHGLLTIGGVLSLAVGSVMLFKTDSLLDVVDLSWEVVLAAVVVSALFFLFIIGFGIRAQRKKPTTGTEGLKGEKGVAFTDLDPDGQVKVHGEIWSATSLSGRVTKGEKIVVEGADRLRLSVRRIESQLP